MNAALLGGLAAQSTLAALAARSTLAAALGLGGLWLLRHRSPLDRAVWLKLALALLLAMPFLPRLHIPMPGLLAQMMAPAPATTVPPVVLAAQAAPRAAVAPFAATPVSTTRARPALSYRSLALMAYGVGVAALLAHLLLGLALLRRWTAMAHPLDEPLWRAALRASGAPDDARLLVSARVKAPLSWGLRHPVILIDPASARRPADASAILAHEAAHIARADWLALMAARVAVALFWFNPLVWVLVRALVQHCEEAADARALVRCAPADYAETLLTCLAGRDARGGPHAVPANGMAAGHGLTRRVHQVLEVTPGALLRRSRGVLAGMTGVAVLAVAASQVSFARDEGDAAPTRGKTTRIVHPDGTVETRQRAANGDTMVDVVGTDGHRTRIRVSRAHGHNVSVVSFGPGDSAPGLPPVPPVPPVAPVPPAPPMAAVPPAPPAPPLPPAPPMVSGDDEGDAPMSPAWIAHIREQALREASKARAEGLAQAEIGRAQAEAARAQAERARVDARAIAEKVRRQFLAQADQMRTEARAQADIARAQARAASEEARAQARAARHAAAASDMD
ncbi:MAG: M56 family metallopeptidase [Sphingomonadales bacterium]|nr:M56 family metallopeptidase [Sphingomonadales bacterium]